MAVSTPGFITFTSNGASCAYQPMSLTKATPSPPNPLPDNATNGDWDCINGYTSVLVSVTGGQGPYSWGATVGNITPNSPTSSAVLTPPTNSGSGVGGIAYGRVAKFCGGLCFYNCAGSLYNCDDSLNCACPCAGMNNTACLSACFGPGAGCAWPNEVPPPNFKIPSCGSNCGGGTASDGCAGNGLCHCDLRSSGMISGGCNPCGVSTVGGSVVTVTDSFGNTAFITVNSLL